MSVETRIFPTALKNPIGKEYSFPIGAELLSTALAGVPQVDEISLWFSSPPQHVATMKLQPVLEVSFFASTPSVYRSRHDPTIREWKIRVRAVARPLRPHIKKVLLEFGLPQAVRPWLIQQGLLSQREGGAWLKLLYDPIQEFLVVQTGSKLLPPRQL